MSTLSLASVLAEPARRTPSKTAVVEGDVRIDYRTLWREARCCAAALAGHGVTPDTRVALLAPNIADFVRSYFGILAAGGIVVPIPTLLGADEAAYILGHSGASIVLHDASFASVATAAAETTGIAAYAVEGLGDDREPVAAHASREADDTAVIFYTSGTTGWPKGAVLTHLNLILNATVNAFDANGFTSEDVVMGCLPLFHTFGQSVSMNSTFRAGATLVLQPRFDADAAIELMVRERTTLLFGVPTMYVQLLQAAPRAAELPALRDCVSGGASLPVAVLEDFEKAFGTTVFEGYGLSETSPSATCNQRCFGTKAGTVGHPLWGVEVQIVDETVENRIVLRSVGELGEIVVRGHNVFAGYLDDPDATAEVMVDGWFRTGDIGRMDVDGFVAVVDRKKDLIIRGGFNVYPREVEDVLTRHPTVGQVAVIGLPDPEQGEEICAVVVPAEDATVDPDGLRAWARERLGGHKYPRQVEVVKELPLGPSHKVLKRELRRRFADALRGE